MFIRSAKELALLVTSQRKKLKLSQADIGKLVGLKQQTVSDFENNPEGTKLSTLFYILSAVNLDLRAFTKNDTTNSQWKEEW